MDYYLLPAVVGVLSAVPFFFSYKLVWKRISNFVWNSLSISVEVYGPRLNRYSEERLYYWVLDWFAENIKNLPHSVAKAESEVDDYGKCEERVDSLPGFDVLIDFQYKGEWFRVERINLPEIQVKTYCDDGPIPYEKLVFTSLPRNRALIYEFLEQCKPKRKDEDEKKTIMYGINLNEWNQIGHPKRRRPLSTVILAEETKEKLIEDVKDFRKSESWYVERGIPYRRGYLLYGPPGCGKSSVIKGIAGEFGYDICILSLTARGLTDHSLNMLMNSTPENCIVLLEDVDAAFKSREGGGEELSSAQQGLAFEGQAPCSTVTFGGLLNALDGVASTEGRLVFMTTNYVDKLDPAMVRPGRVDMKLLVNYPDRIQLAKIFQRFYIDCEEELKEEFVKRVKDLGGKVTMAAVQGLFMFHKNSARNAVDNVEEYFKDQIMISGLLGGDKGSAEHLYQ